MVIKRFLAAVAVIATLFLIAVFMSKDISKKTLYSSIPHNLTRTFAMIKPDAVAAQSSGKIIDMIESNGFIISGLKKTTLSKEQAEQFYAIHKDKPFYNDLVAFMTSGPVIVMALEKENAVQAWRDLIGATNPENAASGTIRKIFGTSSSKNAVHGSDAPETAAQEIVMFFPELKNQ